MTDAPAGFIVTGGTGALGSAVVRALLAQGSRVAVPYLNPDGWDRLRDAENEAAALWGRRADVSDLDADREFTNEAVAWMGRLDGVAAVAGAYAGSANLEAAPDGEWEAMLRTNLASAYATCRTSLPHLLKRGGSVVTVASRVVDGGGAGAAAYAVSKAAVLALTRVLALENRKRGVRFNCVAPGTIDTPANRESMPRADFQTWTPPGEIARVIAFLLSPESAPVTGALVPVDSRA